jgi:hypothetical protein
MSKPQKKHTHTHKFSHIEILFSQLARKRKATSIRLSVTAMRNSHRPCVDRKSSSTRNSLVGSLSLTWRLQKDFPRYWVESVACCIFKPYVNVSCAYFPFHPRSLSSDMLHDPVTSSETIAEIRCLWVFFLSWILVAIHMSWSQSGADIALPSTSLLYYKLDSNRLFVDYCWFFCKRC